MTIAPIVPPLLRVQHLTKRFVSHRGWFRRTSTTVRAVEDVTFHIQPGEVVGLVGESGSGKTTVGRAILRLVEPTSGEIFFEGTDLTTLPPESMRAQRKNMQMIFQDPFASLNPRLTAGAIVEQALQIHGLARGRQRRPRVVEILESVGLSAAYADRYPHEFSGGQRQRIGIARALAVKPRLIIADEAVSALDISVKAQVVNLLKDLQQQLGLAMLFITHDLGVVEYISDRIIVMYLGHVMEIAPSRELYNNPRHPYTEALLSAIPVPDPTVTRRPILLEGDIPSPLNPPSGCVFRTRCPIAFSKCAEVVPPLEEVAPGHFKACIRR
jgi:oligopeptide/dipeptide ABC transporter ATP-binding protein